MTTRLLASVALCAVAACGDVSRVESEPPVTSVSPPPGAYPTIPTVVITADRPATIYYTFDGSEATTPVVPVIVGEDYQAALLWKALFEAGVYTNVAMHPAVPPGGALLRTSLMATHERSHLDRALAVLAGDRQKRRPLVDRHDFGEGDEMAARRADPENRIHSAGAVPVHGNDSRQHPLRKRAGPRVVR